ncbi:hypothetical protein C8E00_10399 [Chromohalobacter marismortui]|uniref:Uncharacterized protein n=1 Tax=Chromohalobacter marismortui TaxID=42055 RepID=A0A4R7NPT3_9GAMM|nr:MULTISPECIES: zinc ribbon domain-containing protein [Chromohalobacter]MCI0508888.1 hypothetical protein [Chromohalobacter sp.]MCI0594255.1 hypothetical protein [Chromohalobacter sp.]TDU22738.1 hypothetical protein C8E00_10399 [Chromohalobacter marismortui]
MTMSDRRLYRCRACQVEVFIKATRRPSETRCPACASYDFESVERIGANPRASVDELLAKALELEGGRSRDSACRYAKPIIHDI